MKLLSASVALTLGLTAAPALAFDVVGCVGANLGILQDPRTCPSDRRIEAISVSVNFQNPLTSQYGQGGSNATQPIPSELKLAKRPDGTSATLFRNSVQGTVVPRLLIAVFDRESRAGGQRLFSILLTDVNVSRFEISATDTGRTGTPTELASFQYAAFQFLDDRTGQAYGYNFRTSQSF